MIDFYGILFTIAGTLIIILLAIIGFFIARLVNDVKSNTGEIGKNKGRIELVASQQKSDIRRIEETTQLEIKSLSGKVGTLSDSVNNLVGILTKNAQKSE